ncbi:hypothetical protein [Nocardia farcinica]|uniref:hypothetical protein n=1 Tax=Nocardia farcinica TaxID=37329 RepID=UPI0018963431|nr:hypothetical protein [Nocardia farcinica]MBF6410891.1 hypothetical protein [Nocardia farcinica]UEX26120.1 hypothetical protein LMJ57_29485 [Nocardia farcinica]
MSASYAVPALLLGGPGVVFAALALSYRRDARRFPATGERPGATTLSAARPSSPVRSQDTRRLAVLRRRQCAPAQHRDPYSTD